MPNPNFFDQLLQLSQKEYEKRITETYRLDAPLLKGWEEDRKRKWDALPWYQKLNRITRRNYLDRKYRIKEAWKMLRGKHECGDW